MKLKIISFIDHLHISDFDYKIIYFNMSYFPLRQTRGAKFNGNNIYFSPKSVQNFNVVTTCEFSICYKFIL